MVKIHGVAWLIIGIFVSVFSWLVKNKAGDNSLLLFFYIGLAFMTVGIVKLIFGKLDQEPKQKKHAIHSNKMLHQHQQRQKQNQPHYKVCFGCGTKHHLHEQYCRKCGTRLR